MNFFFEIYLKNESAKFFFIRNRQKIFVPLQNVLKFFRTPTKTTENFSYPYTIHSAPSPGIKNDRSLRPYKKCCFPSLRESLLKRASRMISYFVEFVVFETLMTDSFLVRVDVVGFLSTEIYLSMITSK